jgi:hypothetical protein
MSILTARVVRTLSFAAVVATGALAATVADARVPLPATEAPKGERCVEDTDFMRRNHMELLKHHRDRTVRQGIRTQQHSLANCVDCHAGTTTRSVLARGPDGREGFCAGCHAYVGVQLDCFECHAATPRTGAAVRAAGAAP